MIVEQVVRNPSQVETTIGTIDSGDEVVNQQQVLIVPTEVPRAVASEFLCGVCEEVFNSLDMLRIHRRTRRCYPDGLPASLEKLCGDFNCRDCTISPVTTRFNGAYRSVTITPTEHCITSDQFSNNTREGVLQVIRFALANGENLKVYTTTSVTFQKVNIADGAVDDEKTFFFSTKAVPIQAESDIDELVERSRNKISTQIDKFTNRGSNWVVASINNIVLGLARYRVLRGGAANFVLPPELAAKKCVLNINTQDNECFKFAVVASLHYAEVEDGNRHLNRRFQYDQFLQRYNFQNIKFPSTAEDIVRFQKDNADIAINALLWVPAKNGKPSCVQPVYHPPHSIVNGRRLATILLVDNHWLAVTSLNRLLSTGPDDHAAFSYR